MTKTLEDLKTLPQIEAIITKKGPSFDLIIIGGGPAGMAAAIYAGRARLKTLLIEKALIGGLASTTYQIENYPGFPEALSGMDLSSRLEIQARKCGADIFYGNVTSIKDEGKKKFVSIEGKQLDCQSLILAMGSEPKKLEVKGEAEFRGRGVSYCATCDGPFYKDKNIVVVGGGNAAIEEALFLTRYAKKISVVHRRNKLRADRILAERVINDPKIFIFWDSVIQEIQGKNRVEKITIKNVKTKKTSKIAAQGIFIYIGNQPSTQLIKGLINTDDEGFIITDDQMKTNVSGIFAAGDIRHKNLRQIVTSASDGAIAATSALKYIEELK